MSFVLCFYWGVLLKVVTVCMYLLVLLPSLDSAQFGSDLARAFGQKARLGSLNFPKSSYLKNFANTSFLKTFEKDHW